MASVHIHPIELDDELALSCLLRDGLTSAHK